ncbi:MAG: HAD family hydrolase [Rhizobiaceae bacterium]
MTQIHHVVFDIGKVLIHYDPELPFRRLIPDANERRWFLDNVCTSPWNIEQDRGRSWEAAETMLIADHPAHADNIRNFRRFWHEMVPHAYQDSVAIMLGLIEQGRDVTMLTNFAADTFAEARKRFDFLNRPRGVTVSADVKLLKPQREIYELHARKFGLDPIRTLFIDDSPANVEGARAAGWQSIPFVDAATLARDLDRLGVAPSA